MKPQEKPAALAQPQQEPVKVQKNEEAAKVQTRPQTASLPSPGTGQNRPTRPEPAQGPRARADPREQLPEETLRIRREDRVDPRVREAVFQAREIQETEAGTPEEEARGRPQGGRGDRPQGERGFQGRGQGSRMPGIPKPAMDAKPMKKEGRVNE